MCPYTQTGLASSPWAHGTAGGGIGACIGAQLTSRNAHSRDEGAIPGGAVGSKYASIARHVPGPTEVPKPVNKAEIVAQKLVTGAFDRGSQDNISVLVVRIVPQTV